MKALKIFKSSKPRGAESRHFQPRGADVQLSAFRKEFGEEFLKSLEELYPARFKAWRKESLLDDAIEAMATADTEEEAIRRGLELLFFGEHFGGDQVRELFENATNVFMKAAEDLEHMKPEEAPQHTEALRRELETGLRPYTSRLAVEPPRKAERIAAYFEKLDASLGKFLRALEDKCPAAKFAVDNFGRELAELEDERDRVAREKKILDREIESKDEKPLLKKPSEEIRELWERRGIATARDLAAVRSIEDAFRRLIEAVSKSRTATRLEAAAERIEASAPPSRGKWYDRRLAFYNMVVEKYRSENGTQDISVVCENLIDTPEAKAAFPKVNKAASLYSELKRFVKREGLTPIVRKAKQAST